MMANTDTILIAEIMNDHDHVAGNDKAQSQIPHIDEKRYYTPLRNGYQEGNVSGISPFYNTHGNSISIGWSIHSSDQLTKLSDCEDIGPYWASLCPGSADSEIREDFEPQGYF